MSRLSSPLFQLSAVRATLRETSFLRYAGGSRSEVRGESEEIRQVLWRRSHDLLYQPPTSGRGLSRLHFLMRSSIRRHHVFSIGFTATHIPLLTFVRFGRFSFRRLHRIPLSFGSHIVRAGASCFHRLASARHLSHRGCSTKLFGSILMSISPRMESNQSAAANRRPAGQLDGSGNLSRPVRYEIWQIRRRGSSCSYLTGQAIVAADRAFPAAVAELGR